MAQQTPIKQRLQFIVQSRTEHWLYSIFWQPTKDANGTPILKWADGHFQGTDMFADVTNYEWFYTLSSLRSFLIEDGTILGCAFTSGASTWLAGHQELQFYDSCDRVKEARLHGIQTLVCVPTPHGVLELGSSDLLQQDWSFVQIAKSLFTSDVSSEVAANHKVPPHPPASAKTELTTVNLDNPQFPRQHFGGRDNMSISTAHCLSNKNRLKKSRGRNQMDKKESALSHVASERIRREKLNGGFYALRSAVPNVSKMDRASLLSDAVTYINQLKSKVDDLEVKLKVDSEKSNKKNPVSSVFDNTTSLSHLPVGMEVDVKIVGSEAMFRVWCEDVNYPVARLMDALRELELQIHHASASRVGKLLVQHVLVKVSNTFPSDEAIKTVLQKMKNP